MSFDLLELERRLISFDTVSHKSNVPMADFLSNLLADLGCRNYP